MVTEQMAPTAPYASFSMGYPKAALFAFCARNFSVEPPDKAWGLIRFGNFVSGERISAEI
jgi:hypothetical protein